VEAGGRSRFVERTISALKFARRTIRDGVMWPSDRFVSFVHSSGENAISTAKPVRSSENQCIKQWRSR
jgi:hypothetical protein